MNFMQNAAAIIRIVASAAEQGAPLSDLVRASGLSEPIAQRIVHILIDERAIVRHPQTQHYMIRDSAKSCSA